jgi:dihydrodipicolinate synthase/N-acetylneuraminate lyase
MRGVIAAMVTPFDDTGERVAVERIPALVDHLAKGGVHGLFICGTTGEGPLLARRGVPVGRTRPPLAWASETEIDALAAKLQVRFAEAGMTLGKGAR